MKSYFKAITAILLMSSVVWACATCGCQADKPKDDAEKSCYSTDGSGKCCKSACRTKKDKSGCSAKQKGCKAEGCQKGCSDACKAKKAGQATDPAKAPNVGDTAPNFVLANYDGTMVNLADHRGKIVVIEWFNYKCPFCVYHYETEPTMHNLVKKYADKNVQFLAINSTSWQTTEENKEFAEKNKVSYPILDDRSGKTGKAYGATRTPHMYIIDKDGKLAYAGAIDNAPLGKLPEGQDKVMNFVDMALAELTDGKPVTIQKTREYGCTVKYADK